MKKEINCCDAGCNTEPPAATIQSLMPALPETDKAPAVCGPPPEPPANPFENPGYQIEHFVETFIETASGHIPQIKTKTNLKDGVQTVLTRMNIGRDDYKVSPGLYCTGNPGTDSPILVTSNYKLTVDTLRKELTGVDAWILVLDTRGINVWCAAGKGTFGTDELVEKIQAAGLDKLVTHRNIIVPQLGAVGVSGHRVKKKTGFKVIWGPVNAKDITGFLTNNFKATPEMREITFTLKERALLIPVEVSLILKPVMYIFLGTLIVSGFGHNFFSFSALWNRGIPAIVTLLAGIIAGAALTPLFLRQLPGIAFSVKGAVAGLAVCAPVALIAAHKTGFSGVTALIFVAVSVSSYLAMNFTGATPFTSPSGVEKEMRKAIPIQLSAIILGIILWLYSAF